MVIPTNALRKHLDPVLHIDATALFRCDRNAQTFCPKKTKKTRNKPRKNQEKTKKKPGFSGIHYIFEGRFSNLMYFLVTSQMEKECFKLII